MKNNKLNQKIKPFRLKRGDTIGVIAPADPVNGVCPPDTIERGYDYLRSRGFKILEGESVKELPQNHTAGSVDKRVADIHNFLRDDSVSCIIAFWGGFNSNQLLDKLDYDLIAEKRKVFIGYSDVTALTTAITSKTGLITFSGPGVISFAKPQPFDYTWEYFEKACMHTEDILVVASERYADDMYFLREDNDHRIFKENKGSIVFKDGSAKGQIIAGNLQTLLLLQGTEYLENVDGKILFIEEDETSTPAHVDRFMCQMHQLGWFNKIAGLVIGRFTEHSQFSKDDTLKEILHRYLDTSSFPVLYDVDFGHSDPMITIPHGGICTIQGNSIVFEPSVI